MYVKLFSSILTSSVWAEDNSTRIVWITLLALADKDGNVRASPSGLARIANVPVDDCHRALGKFLSPDPESSRKEDDGRRIREQDGGWFIISYPEYRKIRTADERRDYHREYARKRRASTRSTTSQQNQPIAEAEAEAEVKNKQPSPAATWLTPYVDRWEQEYGVGSAATLMGRLAKALASLHKAHGQKAVVERLGVYLAATEARFANPQSFAQRFSQWGKRKGEIDWTQHIPEEDANGL